MEYGYTIDYGCSGTNSATLLETTSGYCAVIPDSVIADEAYQDYLNNPISVSIDDLAKKYGTGHQ
jgi:hypothetical protein